MKKGKIGLRKRLVYTLPLMAGCLCLAGVMLLLIGEVVEGYGVENGVSITKGRTVNIFGDNCFYLLEQSRNGFAYIINAFIYYYNKCGYYNYKIPRMQIQNGQISENALQFAFVELYLLLAVLMIVSVIIRKGSGFCYALSAMLLALILFVGRSPGYVYVILAAVLWVYLNLAGNIMQLKGTKHIKEFFKEFPKGMFPIYVTILLVMLIFFTVIPVSVFPEVNANTKDAVFAKLQEIQLVSSQYEENRKKAEEEARLLRNEIDEENNRSEQDMADEDGIISDVGRLEEDSAEADGTDEDGTNAGGENADGENVDGENADGENADDRNTDDENADVGNTGNINDGRMNQAAGGNAGGSGLNYDGIGFSLRSGGGVSRGRTDQTGNLDFSGKTVLKAYCDFKPEETMYIRLFYGEDYEENRWKQTKEEYFDENLDQLVFYGLNGGSINGAADGDVVYIESSNQISGREAVRESKAVSMVYPVAASYLKDTCEAVPGQLDELFKEEFADVFQTDENNLSETERIRRIENVLEETAYYTLSPGTAPKDKDFITWFLTENKRGYCMHFASAGVMMLREAGISARYAEGYAVPVSAWIQQEDGSWSAEVKDSSAHAWAEIYSYDEGGVEDGYWMPVEMTPAYDGELAGSFAGEPDRYVGKIVVPGVVVKIVKIVVFSMCAIAFVFAGMIFYRKGNIWYEKRLLHTGSRRRDVKNMVKLLLKKASRKNSKLRVELKNGMLTSEAFKERIPALIPELEQNMDAAEWFHQLMDYGYKAAFGPYISRQEKEEALELYEKLKGLLRG